VPCYRLNGSNKLYKRTLIKDKESKMSRLPVPNTQLSPPCQLHMYSGAVPTLLFELDFVRAHESSVSFVER
jgi:hypothetical protein